MIARNAGRFLAVTVFALGAPQGLWADGSGEQRTRHVSSAPPPMVESYDAACTDPGGLAGTVTSVSGAAYAQSFGEGPRALACDDLVRACDRIYTSDGGQVALLVDDVYLQLGSASSLTLESTLAEFHVDVGTARVIDTRMARDAAHFRLSTPQLASRGLRSDAEVHVGISGADERTKLCSFGDPMTVSTSEGARMVGAGACIEVVGSQLTTLADGTPSLGLAAPMECRREYYGLVDRFLPTDVAGPPPVDPFPFVGPSDPFGRKSCDDPGSGCSGPPPMSSPSVFLDSVTGACNGFPGAACGDD